MSGPKRNGADGLYGCRPASKGEDMRKIRDEKRRKTKSRHETGEEGAVVGTSGHRVGRPRPGVESSWTKRLSGNLLLLAIFTIAV